MTMKPQSVQIRFIGQNITLKSFGDPAVTQEVLDLASLKLLNAEKRAATGTPSHYVALLALMDLAEEYVKAKRRMQDYRKKMDEKASEISSILAPGKA